MTIQRVFAISGPKESGKTYTAAVIKAYYERVYGFSVHIASFATGLKELCALSDERMQYGICDRIYAKWRELGATHIQAEKVTPLTLHAFFQHVVPTGVKNRTLLQYVGTDIARSLLGEMFWIHYAQDTLKTIPAKFIIFDDLRFDNELSIIDKYVQIDLPYSGEHISEKGLSIPPNVHIAHHAKIEEIELAAYMLLLLDTR